MGNLSDLTKQIALNSFLNESFQLWDFAFFLKSIIQKRPELNIVLFAGVRQSHVDC